MKVRLFAAVIVAVVGYFLWSGEAEEERQAAGETALADALKLVSDIEPYAKNSQYVDDVVRQAHERSFNLTYRKGAPGGRHRAAEAATFRKDDYLKWLFHHAIRQVRRDYNDTGNRKEIARLREIRKALETLREEQGIARVGA